MYVMMKYNCRCGTDSCDLTIRPRAPVGTAMSPYKQERPDNWADIRFKRMAMLHGYQREERRLTEYDTENFITYYITNRDS
jgi:hypothetical protein